MRTYIALGVLLLVCLCISTSSAEDAKSRGDKDTTEYVDRTAEEYRSKHKNKKQTSKGGHHVEYYYHEPPSHHGGGHYPSYGFDGDVLSMGAGLTFILAALALIVYMGYLAFGSGGGGGGDHGGYDYGHQKYRSMDDPDSTFNLKILDWIAMLEEIYRKFDMKQMDCQKRLICELRQNEEEIGPVARKMNRALNYLQFLDGVQLPQPIQGMVTEYTAAARESRNLNKKCEEVYTDCQFSVKDLFRKYYKQSNNHL